KAHGKRRRPGGTGAQEPPGAELADLPNERSRRLLQLDAERETRQLERYLRWRRNHESNFRYNPNEPVDRRDVEAMDLELALRRQDLLSMVRKGPGALASLSREIRAARDRLMLLLEDAWTALKMAEAVRDAK